MSSRLRILVSGMIAADPHQGGATWAVLQYVLGFERLGHEVCFVEPVPSESIVPLPAGLGDSDNARYFRQVVAAFGLERRSALLRTGTQESVGLTYPELRKMAKRTDVLINISGMLTDEALVACIPTRVYLDLDPAFNQLWHVAQGIDMRFRGHTHFVTVGQEIGQPGCPVPTSGRVWIPTLQPIILEHWPVAEAVTRDALTTVANWRGYGSIEFQGVNYGQKAHSLRRFMTLPKLTTEKFILALSIHPNETQDLAALVENGWQLLDPARVAQTPAAYREFIQGSWAEFGIAKSGYVASRCGWFSDRSVCYLASGRPVIAQETGYSRSLPTGCGLLNFGDLDSALVAIDALRRDYREHSKAARAIATTYFRSDKVLGRLLDEVGI